MAELDLSLLTGIAAAMCAVALLYSSVGHGGGSGYLAVMALFGVAPALMKPTALSLNVVVASLATFRFAQAGHFRWRLFWPFAAASIPAAYVGGAVTLPGDAYRLVVGAILLYAAIRLARSATEDVAEGTRPPPLPAALAVGAGIGLLSGLVGVGGGIFLSPVLLLAGWAGAHVTAAVSAAFILVNSVAGLAGHLGAATGLPAALPFWATAVATGGWVGSSLGSRRLPSGGIRAALAAVLLVASVKFFLA